MLLGSGQHAHVDGETSDRGSPDGYRLQSEADSLRQLLVGKHGEYLLSLTNGMEHAPDPTKSLFALQIAEEVPGSHLHLSDFNDLERIFTVNDQILAGNGLELPLLRRHALRTMEVQLSTSVNATEAYITSELHPTSTANQRVLWEVYCGKAQTGHIAEDGHEGGTLLIRDWLGLQPEESPSAVSAALGC